MSYSISVFEVLFGIIVELGSELSKAFAELLNPNKPIIKIKIPSICIYFT